MRKKLVNAGLKRFEEQHQIQETGRSSPKLAQHLLGEEDGPISSIRFIFSRLLFENLEVTGLKSESTKRLK